MFKKTKKLLILTFFITAILLAGRFALAQSADNLLFGGVQNETQNALGLGTTNDAPQVIIARIINIALGFLGIVAVGLIMYSGWLWMTAAGNMERIEKAKKILIGAVIGLIIILASFAIATFVLNKLYGVTGGGGASCNPGDTRSCGCNGTGLQTCSASGIWNPCSVPPCGGLPSSLLVTGRQPADLSTVPMNTVVRYRFNQGVDGTTVDSSSFTVDDSSGTVAGSYTTIGSQAEFVPSGACPSNACGATECFAANETINVLAVAGSIMNQAGTVALTCSLANPCTLTFNVSDTVDCQKPSVALLPTPLPQICVDDPINPSVDLGFNASDDSGVSQVVFDVDGGTLDFLTPDTVFCGAGTCGQLPGSWNVPPGAVQWYPTSANYTAGTSYTLNATAYDLDKNQTTDSETLVMRVGHCCNGTQDVDETGQDCGGADCAACNGAQCDLGDNNPATCITPDDSLCASNFCDTGTCTCASAPIIDWVTPVGGFCDGSIDTPCQTNNDCLTFAPNTCNMSDANGTDGNLVTIGGRFFGTTAGTVTFNDGVQTLTASLADTVNNNCTNSWTDNQIIVVRPNGLANPGTGTVVIEVIASNNFKDNTQSMDGRGPDLNFKINSIVRPGLCLLNNPLLRVIGAPVGYEGIRLSGSQAYFGNINNNTIGLPPNNFGATSGTAGVPNIQTGKTTTFAINGKIGSNYLNFTKDPEPKTGPQITSFSPAQGPAGQYVTIYGSGFGATRGTSKVNFNFGANSTEAKYTFPAECANSVWSDKQVIVKVPSLPNDPAGHVIEMIIPGYSPINTGANLFNFDNTLPLAPSLCKIQPIIGPNLTPVTLWGEYFGAQGTGSVNFQLNQSGVATLWNSPPPPAVNQINTNVPLAAVSGPVQVIQSGLAGNGINFQVGNCTQDADCGFTPQDICCPAGSFREYECAVDSSPYGNNNGATDINDCYYNGGSSVYEWDFSTAPKAAASTCSGYNYNQCTDTLLCPNSPGNCQPSVDNKVYGYCGDLYCDSNYPQCTSGGGNCAYNATQNKCELLGSSCDQTDVSILSGYTSECKNVSGNGVWQVDMKGASCPAGSYMDINGWCTVGSIGSPAVCALCASGFECESGMCKVPDNICPGGTSCGVVSSPLYRIQQGTAIDETLLARFATNQDAATFYNYSASSFGNPLFYSFIKGERSEIFIHYNPLTNISSVAFFHDYPNDVLGGTDDSDGGTATFTIDSITAGNKLAVGDEPGEAPGNAGYEIVASDTWDWTWLQCCTDGGMIEMPGNTWSITITPNFAAGIDDWVFVYNNPISGPQYLKLATDEPITISSTGISYKECVSQQTSCECCCRTDPAFEGLDCCLGLTCNPNYCDDTNTAYGQCTGCTVVVGGAIDQALSDQACNCSGTSLKVCNTTGGGDSDFDNFQDGICIDAALQGTPCSSPIPGSVCNGLPQPPCNVGLFCDPVASCTCQPVVVGTPCDEDQNTAATCDISIPPDFCETNNPNLYCDPNTCLCAAKGQPVGAECLDATSTTVPQACDPTTCSAAYQCFSETIFSPPVAGDCGSCCCEVGPGDNCGSIDPALSCQYDTGSGGKCDDTQQGTPPDFGLCCGCSDDNQCGDPATTACSSDTCCRPRPYITPPAAPADGAQNVCRNTQISVDFNEQMDKGSFSGNIIVAGDYGNSICPAGTQYLVFGEEKGIFARIWFKIKRAAARVLAPIFPGARALAQNFCAIAGTVSGRHNPNNTSTLTFAPKDLLDNNITYYVIIKGDGDLSDSVNEGVLNRWGVSMPDMGNNWPDYDGDGTNGSVGDRTLNGIAYYGYAFSFTTMPAQAKNNGVCVIDHIKIAPDSYLFQTTGDDLNEVDTNINDNSFDSSRDNDKVFTAEAIAGDGSVLAPVAGVYDWTWSWAPGNTSVVNYDANNPYSTAAPVDSTQLFEAQTGMTDAKTTIDVTATLGAGGPGSFTGQAQVWVFTCENPWPPINPITGNWAPWSDASGNCTAGAPPSCANTNYELYYCRDSGGVGTEDDLPAILSSGAIIMGSSTVTNLLKEFYFLRETAPNIASGMNLAVNDISTTTEGVASVQWNAITLPNPADGYKLYYGTSSGKYNNYIDVGNILTYDIYGLTTGKTYYFAATAYFNTGAESGYSNEVSVALGDLTPPQVPNNLTVISACNNEAAIRWDANTDDTAGYKVYYGAIPGQYGGSVDAGNTTSITLTGLANSQYYLAVTAYDASGNESIYSADVAVNIMPVCGLVSYWPFEAENAGVTPDEWGSNDGDMQGGVSLIGGGKIGNMMTFDGANGYINLGNKSSLHFGIGDFTISAWINTSDNILNKTIYGADQGNIVTQLRIDAATGLARIDIRDINNDEVQIAGSTDVTDGSWHHIVGVLERGSLTGLRIYVDAILENYADPAIVDDLTTSPDIFIGKESSSVNIFSGLMDEVKIFSRALSDTEIQDMYNTDLFNSVQSSLIANWKFEEGSGSITYDSVGSNDGNMMNSGVSRIYNGIIGRALDFNGTNGYVEIPDNNSLDMTGSTSFSISAWINNPSYSGDQQIIEKNQGNGSYGLAIKDNTLIVAVSTDINNFIYRRTTNGNFLSDGSRYHIAFVMDGTTANDIHIYIDGVSVPHINYTSQGAFTGLGNSPNSLSIGYSLTGASGPLPLNGIIDEVIIFSRALSGSEILNLYNSYP